MNRGPLFDGMWRRRGHPTSDGVGNTAQRSAEAKIASMLWLGDQEGDSSPRGDGGADHVLLQVLGSDLAQLPMEEWRALAPAVTAP